MRENTVFCFVVVHHGGNDLLDVRILQQFFACFLRVMKQIIHRGFCEQTYCVDCSVGVMMLKIAASISCMQELQSKIFVVLSYEDDFLSGHQIEDKLL